MTSRTVAQHDYWKNVGSRPWQPLRYITEAGLVHNPENSPALRLLAIDVTEVLSRHVKNLPGDLPNAV